MFRTTWPLSRRSLQHSTGLDPDSGGLGLFPMVDELWDWWAVDWDPSGQDWDDGPEDRGHEAETSDTWAFFTSRHGSMCMYEIIECVGRVERESEREREREREKPGRPLSWTHHLVALHCQLVHGPGYQKYKSVSGTYSLIDSYSDMTWIHILIWYMFVFCSFSGEGFL